MAYVKTVWETGDVITAAKLNNAEDGIEAHDPIILAAEGTASGANWDFSFEDITFGNIVSAVQAGKTVMLILSYGTNTYAVSVTGCNIYTDGADEKVYSMEFSAMDVYVKNPEEDKPLLSDPFEIYVMSME